MRHFLFIVSILTFLACVGESEPRNAKKAAPVIEVSNSNLTGNDTLRITKRSAVFVLPDTLEIEKRKKEIGEENFYIGADDYLFYLNTAHEFLDSMKLDIVMAKDKKILEFRGNDRMPQLIRLDSFPELWSIYFFDPNKKPKHVDMTAIEEEYEIYFQ